jgi:hypothetical protein
MDSPQKIPTARETLTISITATIAHTQRGVSAHRRLGVVIAIHSRRTWSRGRAAPLARLKRRSRPHKSHAPARRRHIADALIDDEFAGAGLAMLGGLMSTTAGDVARTNDQLEQGRPLSLTRFDGLARARHARHPPGVCGRAAGERRLSLGDTLLRHARDGVA